MTDKTRRHRGGPSHPFPVWNGIFEHRRKIQESIWVFLWCIDRITKEEAGTGFVLGGSPVTAAQIADELKDCERTVRRHLQSLAGHGYITLKRAAYGFRISVENSHKFNIWRPDTHVRSLHERSDTAVLSVKKEIGHECPADRTRMSARPDSIVRSNKETQQDSAVTQQKPCNKCDGKGVRPHPGHPGSFIVCEHARGA